ncbi:MAG: TonB-dependent receptor plug domain-containing protein, partial [Sphingobacterium sp.]
MIQFVIKCTMLLISITLSFSAIAQTPVTGKILDNKSKEPLGGATVSIEGTTLSTTTDAQGIYSITAPSANTNIQVSFVGYLTKVVALGTNRTLNIELVPDDTQLDDVVVIGYGTAKRRDITGAVSSLNEKDFNKGVNTSPEQLLAGKVAGVTVVQSSGEPGGGISVNVRGVGSINGGNSPLYVVDGFPIDNSVTVGGTGANFTGMRAARNPLNSINPSDIASIEVLKDASATAIYGSRGANGVVLITTKRGKSGDLKVDYDAYYGIQNVQRGIDILNTEEYQQVINGIIDEGGGTENQRVGQIQNSTNW